MPLCLFPGRRLAQASAFYAATSPLRVGAVMRRLSSHASTSASSQARACAPTRVPAGKPCSRIDLMRVVQLRTMLRCLRSLNRRNFMEHPHGEIFVAMSSHEANSVMLLMELMSRFLSGVFSMTSQATSEVP